MVQITDSAGNIVNSYEYDEWGNITSQTEGIENEFKYAGQTYDSETGLYYLRARYYDPTTGRFISKDSNEGSIVNPLSLNLYTYCVNNPIIFVDPSGNVYIGVWLNNINDNYIGGPLNSFNDQYIGGPLNQIASGDYTPIENAIIFLDDAGNATMGVPALGGGLKITSGLGKGALKLGKAKTLVKGKAAIKGARDIGKFSKHSPEQIEKIYGLKKGQFHREVKDDILSDLTGKNSPYKDQMKKMGKNPDIYLTPDGQIQIVSREFKGKSFTTDLNIKNFLP